MEGGADFHHVYTKLNAVFNFFLQNHVFPYRLFILLKRFPIQSRGREKKMAEVCLILLYSFITVTKQPYILL